VAVLDKFAKALNVTVKPSERAIPPDVKERTDRGRTRLQQVVPYRNEALEAWRGNQYWYVDSKGVLQQQFGGPSGIRAPGKASWRVREPHNILIDIVAGKVSDATARVPSYEVVPATGDPEDASAARVAERIAIYGYDKWDLHEATVAAVTHAIVTGEAFVWPYWDSSVGPFIQGTDVGLGEVCVEVYSGNQVYWEPGQRFEKSAWCAIDIAMTPEAVKRLDGYNGPKVLQEDADILSKSQSNPERKMVLVTYYLERPTPKEPKGRWLTLANQQVITENKDYPGDGQKPCLHRLSYIQDPDSDRDMGLVPQLLPALRTYNDACNKISEWKNLHLMGGRVFIQRGAMKQQLTDEPGAAYYVNGNPNEMVKVWDAPPIPPELFRIKEDALTEMARIAAQNDIPSQVESEDAIAALNEKDRSRERTFLQGVANLHAAVMRADLQLVQQYYDERRVIAIKGDFGWESEQDFRGANLSSNIDVRVFPASIEPLTRQAVEQRVIAFADRQWISPEAAMHAISSGTAENLIKDLELQEARVLRVIRRIKEGPESLFNMPMRLVPTTPDPMTGMLPIDPMTGMPMLTQETPGWMPLPWDNLKVWRSRLETFFSTEAAETFEPGIQAAANAVYMKVLELEAQEAMRQQMMMQAEAAQQGLGNAAKPQGPPPSPDQPKLGQGNGGPPTPNQPAAQSQPS
jgi:hypothetical protein